MGSAWRSGLEIKYPLHVSKLYMEKKVTVGCIGGWEAQLEACHG